MANRLSTRQEPFKELPVQIENTLHSSPYAITVMVIGAGGTGSQILQYLGRLHKALQARGQQGLGVIVMDGDRVTPANIGRQLFTDADINRFKCEVLIERINRFYSTEWEAVPEYLNPTYISYNSVSANILITCTDTAQSRLDMHEHVIHHGLDMSPLHDGFKNHFWIDTGNTADTGQVILSSRNHRLPTVIDLYPNISDFETKDQTPSCSLAEALDRQHLFINSVIAQVASMLLFDICTKPVINWYGAYVNLNNRVVINKITGHGQNNDKIPNTNPRKRRNKNPKAESDSEKPKRTGRRNIQRHNRARKS